MSEVIKKNVLGDVSPGVFYEDLTDLTLYAQEVARERGVWTHVLVHDDRDPRAPLLVLAHEGTVNPSGRGAVARGRAEGRRGAPRRAHRDRLRRPHLPRREPRPSAWRTPSSARTTSARRRRSSPRGSCCAAAEDARSGGRSPAPFLTAFHVRLAEGLTPLAFALFGVPLAMSSRAARTRGYMLALGAYVAYYIVRAQLREPGHRRAARALARRHRTKPRLRRLRDLALRPPHPAGAGGLMRGLLLRHVLKRYLVLVGAVLAGLLVVFLVADFVDRARAYTGPNWVRDVVELYGWKALVATHQLAPAALLLASATLVSLLRRRGELTAILALGFGRRVLFLPVGAVALVTAARPRADGRVRGGARQPAGGRDHRAALPPLGRLALLLRAQAVVPAPGPHPPPRERRRGVRLPRHHPPAHHPRVRARRAGGRHGHGARRRARGGAWWA